MKKRLLEYVGLFFAGGLVALACTPLFTPDKNAKQEELEKEGIFWVVELDENGKIKEQVLADYIRENKRKREFVCRDFYSNDLYIFGGKISYRDLTLTKDYLNFTRDFGAVK